MAECFFVGLAACLAAFEALGAPTRSLARRILAPGLAVGSAIWALSLLGADWPTAVTVVPELTLTSLAIAVLGAGAAFHAYAHCEGKLCLIGGGALIGAGMAASHGVMLLALRGAGDISFDSTPFFVSVAISSATGAASLLIFRRKPDPAGQAAAAFCLAAGMAIALGIGRAAIQLQPGIVPHVAGLLPAAQLAPLAAAFSLIVVVAVRPVAREPAIRRATRLLA
jgi:diguanylate cyclase